jgi:UPF0176 protein
MAYQVLLFYKYVTIEDPKAVADWVRARATELGMTGRVIVAGEGINATLEGEQENTELFVSEFLKDPRFSDTHIKRSAGTGDAFPKLSVKVRDEIVSTRLKPEEADPRIQTATHLSPDDLYSWFESGKEFAIVDMRNSYEFESGHFKNSIDPGMRASRDLPNVVSKLEPLKEKTVVTVCTGGVRCEKMSAFLLHKGFTNVYQLDGGIHSYMEKYPGKDFLGGLYTFDQRVMMNFGGDREIIGRCRFCGVQSEEYINCADPECHLHFIACGTCVNGQSKYCSEKCEQSHKTKV